MQFTSGIEDLAEEAKRTGRTETDWLLLRNVSFTNGTPEDAWANMVKRFQKLGVRTTPVHQTINRKVVTKVVLVPLSATNQGHVHPK
jgi:hypothetical protein